MASNELNKEPDFYPFRLKEHGWVLRKGVPIESIGEAFKEIVYQLVTKDFQKGSVAEAMYNDAIEMMRVKSEKGRKAAEARWHNETPPETPRGRAEKMPASKNIVINWAIDNKIDPDDAGECWEATKERNWRDANGNLITNWKAFVTAWCKTRKENRR